MTKIGGAGLPVIIWEGPVPFRYSEVVEAPFSTVDRVILKGGRLQYAVIEVVVGGSRLALEVIVMVVEGEIMFH